MIDILALTKRGQQVSPLLELQRMAAMITFYEETVCDPFASRQDVFNAMNAITRIRKQQVQARLELHQ